MIEYILLISRQGKLHLAKWFVPMTTNITLVHDLTHGASTADCNFPEYKVVEPTDRLIPALFFVCGIEEEDNELITEIVHRFVEVLDRYFGNVSVCCTSRAIPFQNSFTLLARELVMTGELQDSSKTVVLSSVRPLTYCILIFIHRCEG
ncbi:hypothetical protein L208DRAFT_1341970 [Tricholoma matsutake]|nr:hypothetical protein L208DRAFT_1341970 [Tricholoma matsutake 945]